MRIELSRLVIIVTIVAGGAGSSAGQTPGSQPGPAQSQEMLKKLQTSILAHSPRSPEEHTKQGRALEWLQRLLSRAEEERKPSRKPEGKRGPILDVFAYYTHIEWDRGHRREKRIQIPFPDTGVILFPPGAPEVLSVNTDRRGHAQFPGLVAGETYQVCVNRPGFGSMMVPVTMDQPKVRVEIEAYELRYPIQGFVRQNGKLEEGHFFWDSSMFESRPPVAGAVVKIWPESFENGGPTPESLEEVFGSRALSEEARRSLIPEQVTGADGYFGFLTLAAGYYRVEIHYPSPDSRVLSGGILGSESLFHFAHFKDGYPFYAWTAPPTPAPTPPPPSP